MFKSTRFKLAMINALTMLIFTIMLSAFIYGAVYGSFISSTDAQLEKGINHLQRTYNLYFIDEKSENNFYISPEAVLANRRDLDDPKVFKGITSDIIYYTIRNKDMDIVVSNYDINSNLIVDSANIINDAKKAFEGDAENTAIKNEQTENNTKLDDDDAFDKLEDINDVEDLEDRTELNANKNIINSLSYKGYNYRMITKKIVDGTGTEYVLQAYANFNFESFMLTRLKLTLFVFAFLVTSAAMLIGWIFAGPALKPISDLVRQQRELIGNASHELRTPLTVIQANLEVIQTEEKAEEYVEPWLQNSLNECQRMGALINDLLFLAKADAGKEKIIKQEIDLSQLVADAASGMNLIFKDKNISFTSQVEPDLKVMGDASRLKQVIGILLDNAIKYTPEDGEVKLKLYSKNNNKFIVVEDSGIGIPPEDKEQIFERFFRVDKARSRSQGGSGLGLSIANQIVKEHNGKIYLDSKMSKGSKFTVELQ